MSAAIFIGGCDRSGTTLLGAMLGSHSRCICTPESQFVCDLLSRFPDLKKPHLGRDLLDYLFGHSRFNLWGLRRNQFQALENQMLTHRELMSLLVEAYASRTQNIKADHWVDQTPSNVSQAKTLTLLFGSSRFIHLVRDGRAVASSIIPLNWGPRSADRAAYFWLRNLAFGLAAESYLNKSRILRVKYEDLVSRPKQTMMEICDFLNLTFEEPMLSGKGFAVPTYTKRQHSLVGRPPDPSRISDWKGSLSAREIEVFESIAKDMLLYLEYEPIYGSSARPMSLWERAISSWKHIISIPLNLVDQLSLFISAQQTADFDEGN